MPNLFEPFAWELFRSHLLISGFVTSIVLVVSLLGVRALLYRMVVRQIPSSESRRRWMINIRNATVLAMVMGLGLIWVDEIRTLALSLVAVAVALVVATKELIQCAIGSMLRTATTPYEVGDRIEVGGHRGDVIDINIFTTTILEVGPGRSFHQRTGRTVMLPNLLLLTGPIINESSLKRFVLHVLTIPLKQNENWLKAEEILLRVATEVCQPYLEEVRRHMEKMEKDYGLEGLPVQPRVFLSLPEAGQVQLLVRFPAPVGKQGRMEQVIVRRYLEEYREARNDGNDQAAEPGTLPQIT